MVSSERARPNASADRGMRHICGAARTRLNRPRLVCFPYLRHVVGERIVRVWRGEERLNREEDGADLQRRAPLVLENVEADAPEPINIRVVDFRQEANLRRERTEREQREQQQQQQQQDDFKKAAAKSRRAQRAPLEVPSGIPR